MGVLTKENEAYWIGIARALTRSLQPEGSSLDSFETFPLGRVWGTIRGTTVQPYSSLSHADLVQAVADTNDAAACEEFVRRYCSFIAKVVYRTARRCGQSSNIVADLTQQIFLKLWDNDRRVLKMFESRHPDAIYGYLARVSVNLVLDQVKPYPSDETIDSDNVDTLPDHNSPEQAMLRPVLIEQINFCINKHTSGPNKQRDLNIFQLHYRHGFSAREIASLLALETKAVESVIHRLTQLVRSKLAEGSAPLGADPGEVA